MIGVIIGDIAGSRFEFNNYRKKDFTLMDPDKSFFTDDTIMSLAIAKALIETKDNNYIGLSNAAVKYMQEIGRPYPGSGYGGRFFEWMYTNEPEPYYSFGNGAAMRVAACGFIAKDLPEAVTLARKVTEVTHNHPEGIKGAQAVAAAVYLAKTCCSKHYIRKFIETCFYKLDFTIDEIRPTYKFNETCQDTVPQAIEAFLESESFEDAIRIAVSVGGDSDTLAAITGGIAEAYYGVPRDLEQQAYKFLDPTLKDLYKECLKNKIYR